MPFAFETEGSIIFEFLLAVFTNSFFDVIQYRVTVVRSIEGKK